MRNRPQQEDVVDQTGRQMGKLKVSPHVNLGDLSVKNQITKLQNVMGG